MNTWYDEKYKFYHAGYSDIYKVCDSNQDNHQFVSKNKDGEILGLISYSIDRINDYVDGMGAINFSNDKITYGIDLMKVMTDIFEKYNFRKIAFGVVVGNPIEQSYDRIIKKFGGRIVGVYRAHCKLMDNKFYDSKHYEIFRNDYLNTVN